MADELSGRGERPASRSDGRLRLDPGRAGRSGRIDHGPGIAPEVLLRLFEPRFTTEHGRVRYGLGQGLAISQRIILGHGGTIEVTSEPGRTVATVRLPAT